MSLNRTEPYKFRVEADATDHTFRWYLDGKYMDKLPFEGQPDKIRIAITSQDQQDIGYIDDIFLQKIIGPPTATPIPLITTTTNSTILSSGKVVTSTTTQFSTITSTLTTTRTDSLTNTTTLRLDAQAGDYSTYAWALSATVATAVLVVILLLQKRRTK